MIHHLLEPYGLWSDCRNSSFRRYIRGWCLNNICEKLREGLKAGTSRPWSNRFSYHYPLCLLKIHFQRFTFQLGTFDEWHTSMTYRKTGKCNHLMPERLSIPSAIKSYKVVGFLCRLIINRCLRSCYLRSCSNSTKLNLLETCITLALYTETKK